MWRRWPAVSARPDQSTATTRSTPGRAGIPRVARRLRRLFIRTGLARFPGFAGVEALGQARRPPRGGGGGAGGVTAGEPPAVERAPGDDAHAVALTGREHAGLHAPYEH